MSNPLTFLATWLVASLLAAAVWYLIDTALDNASHRRREYRLRKRLLELQAGRDDEGRAL